MCCNLHINGKFKIDEELLSEHAPLYTLFLNVIPGILI